MKRLILIALCMTAVLVGCKKEPLVNPDTNQDTIADTIVDPDYVEGALKGRFSVSATHQVRFAKGNLQYRASTDTWRFADRQYDVLDSSNAFASATYDGWIDIFGWGTSGYHDSNDPYNVRYQPYSTQCNVVNSTYNYAGYGPSTNMADPSLTGSSANYDWGVYNPISNAGNRAGMWRTLTLQEWKYLLFSRPDASSKYGYARIIMDDGTHVDGCAFLPDDWSLPEGLSFTPGVTVGVMADFSVNSFSIEQWGVMEAAGAVFLPLTSLRMHGGHFVASGGYTYWLSTVKDCEMAYCILLSQHSPVEICFTSDSRHDGHAVRLFYDVE